MCQDDGEMYDEFGVLKKTLFPALFALFRKIGRLQNSIGPGTCLIK
jgi:hypothetical protein